MLNLSVWCLYYFSPFASKLVPTNLPLNFRRFLSSELVRNVAGILGMVKHRERVGNVPSVWDGRPELCQARGAPASSTAGGFMDKPHFGGAGIEGTPTVPSSKDCSVAPNKAPRSAGKLTDQFLRAAMLRDDISPRQEVL